MKNVNDLMLKTNNDLLENISKIKELYIYNQEDYEDSILIQFIDNNDTANQISVELDNNEIILYIEDEIVDEFAGEHMENVIDPVMFDPEKQSFKEIYKSIMLTITNFLKRFEPKEEQKKNNVKGYGLVTKKHLKELYENPKCMFKQEDRLICDLLSNIRKMEDTNKKETIETAYDILTTHCKDNFLEILHYIKLFDVANGDVY